MKHNKEEEQIKETLTNETIGVMRKEPYEYFSSWILDENHRISRARIDFFRDWIGDRRRTNMKYSGHVGDNSLYVRSINIKIKMPHPEIYRRIFEESWFELTVGDKKYNSFSSTRLANPAYLESMPDGQKIVNAEIRIDHRIAVPSRQLFYVTMNMTERLQERLNTLSSNTQKEITVTLDVIQKELLSEKESEEISRQWREKTKEEGSESLSFGDYCASLKSTTHWR